jgi:hypothetical protein
MPYRDQPPKDLLEELQEIGRRLDDARKTILAVRLSIVFLICIIAIQAISNCMLVRIHEGPNSHVDQATEPGRPPRGDGPAER